MTNPEPARVAGQATVEARRDQSQQGNPMVTHPEHLSVDLFCARADLSPGGRAAKGPVPTVVFMRMVGRVALALHRLPKPTVALVNGPAYGAGCNLALGCDLVVASDSARFCEVFSRRGLTLDCGGSWLLPRLIGLQRAKELAFLADDVPAAEALAAFVARRRPVFCGG